MSLSLEQLLDKYVPVKNPEGCWLWTGSKTKKGYASCRYEDHTGIVHRLVYESFTGPIPVEMEIDHLCRMRHCVNPAHLQAVTHIENLRRGESYWRNRTHCSHGHAYTAENTYITSSGTRACRACRFERSHRADNWKGNVRPGERTHCPQGHPYDKENTYFAPRGGRRCKECNRVRVPAHNSRFKWANGALTNLDFQVQQFAPAVVLDPAVQSAGDAIDDSGLQGATETAIQKQL